MPKLGEGDAEGDIRNTPSNRSEMDTATCP